MMFGLFRKAGNDRVIDELYLAIVNASRRASLYADLAVPDTFEGRFECLALHAILVLRRLQSCEAPGPDMAQHLVDTVFKHFDRTLREMGVGDTTVPKRMRTMAEAFLGRSSAYDAAIRDGGSAFVSALSRNVYAGKRDGVALAAYAEAAIMELAATPLQTFVDAAVVFPDPSSFAGTHPAMEGHER